jgi:hypothetical protein
VGFDDRAAGRKAQPQTDERQTLGEVRPHRDAVLHCLATRQIDDLADRGVDLPGILPVLPSQRVIRAPWPSATPLLCRVRAEIFRFSPQPGGEVSLSGRFVLLPERGERPLETDAVDLPADPSEKASSKVAGS